MRRRLRFALAAAVTIALGLAVRGIGDARTSELVKDAGDALYAAVAYFGLGVLAPRARARVGLRAGVAGAYCAVIELSQLAHPGWLEGMRDTLAGRLVLGREFRALDLVSYGVGIVVAVGAERGARRIGGGG